MKHQNPSKLDMRIHWKDFALNPKASNVQHPQPLIRLPNVKTLSIFGEIEYLGKKQGLAREDIQALPKILSKKGVRTFGKFEYLRGKPSPETPNCLEKTR
jgi:hypothetical protein